MTTSTPAPLPPLALPEAESQASLSSTETLIWTGQRLESDSPLYNMALAMDIAGPVDAIALQKALTRLVRRADSLRTVIRGQGGEPMRVVLYDVVVELDVVDVPEDRRSPDAVAQMLEERTRRSFVLGACMTDTALFRLGGERSILYVNQHHLITDASSAGLLYRDLATEYARVLDRLAPSSEPVPQYRDYVDHLQTLTRSPHFERAQRYWQDTRLERSSDLQFYGALSVGSGRTERVRVSLGAERAAALEQVIERPAFRALTVEHSRFLAFATVLSAWHARASDESEVSIGTPSHNRTTSAERETLGLFIELYPLRVRLAEEETFTSLAQKVSAGTLDMMRHVVPGAGASPSTRDFRVVLNYITARIGDFGGIPAKVDWVHSGFGDRKHALRLQVHDFDDSGVPTLDFDLDVSVFGEVERRWAVEHFFSLFDHLVSDTDAPISEVLLVSPDDEALFAPSGVTVPPGPGVLTRLADRVREQPNDIAVVDDDEEISYSDFASRVTTLADRLRTEGVGAGQVVAICLDRSADQIVAMFGVLAAGAAYLPLDPGHPDDRIAWQVADSAAQIILTHEQDVVRVADWGARPLVHASRPDHPGASEAGAVVDPDWDDGPPDALAYVLYTSGSTGRPKGVEVTRDSLDDYVGWASRTYDRGARLSWAYFTSPAFDLTVTSVFTPLVSGGSVVCYADPEDGRGLLVRDVVVSDRVDAVKLTPSHLELLRDLDCSRSRIRRLVLGGEDLRASAALRTHESFGGHVEILNEYGPTEATVACMIHQFDPASDVTGSVPIGVAADNARIRVLGPSGGPTMRGESGEICVAGPRVAKGYRGAPELTASSFVDDAFLEGGRMYRTGDRGRWTARGVLEFHGRRDDQVKIGGVRLELAEVETAMGLHPGVDRAVARLVHSDSMTEDRHCRLCGLGSSHPEAQLDASGLCSVCARFESEKERVASYFGTLEDLQELLRDARARATGEHDCIMLYSGGKDSTYALCRIVELGARPLVFLLDNGYISDQAKENVRRVTDLLGLELVVGSTPAMPVILAESLSRFSNVCQGCFKAVYTLALNLAVERGIGAIVTGLSRGQIFETRLADLYRNRIYDPATVDLTILEARKAYHSMDDAVVDLFDTDGRDVDDVLDTVRFIDFYRYTDVELADMLDYVREHTPWIRPSDTGRSTNCLINEAGIFVHRTERGFHNYALPYSWDVRLGHKERDAALAELDDELDPAAIRRMLDEVGYRERPAPATDTRLVAYYTGEEVPSADLRQTVGARLPEAAIPSAFVRLDEMPLTSAGKVDRASLPFPDRDRPVIGVPFVAPRTPVEEKLAEIWASVLGLSTVGIHDDFFECGGESLRCIQITSRAHSEGLAFSPRDLFANPTIARLSGVVRALEPGAALAPATVSAAELDSLNEEFGQ